MLDNLTQFKIIELSKKNTEEVYDEIRKILLDYISKNPTDIDVRLKLIKHTYSTRRVYTLDILDYIFELLKYDSNNIYALLFLAYMKCYDLGVMDSEYDQLIDRLKVYQCENSEIMAMVAIAISWYYQLKNDNIERERWIKKSIEYCPDFVRNYYELIVLYFEQNRENEAKELIPFTINNIKHVFDRDNYMNDQYLQDSMDIEEFFNVRYKQIHVWKEFRDKLLNWQNI